MELVGKGIGRLDNTQMLTPLQRRLTIPLLATPLLDLKDETIPVVGEACYSRPEDCYQDPELGKGMREGEISEKPHSRSEMPFSTTLETFSTSSSAGRKTSLILGNIALHDCSSQTRSV